MTCATTYLETGQIETSDLEGDNMDLSLPADGGQIADGIDALLADDVRKVAESAHFGLMLPHDAGSVMSEATAPALTATSSMCDASAASPFFTYGMPPAKLKASHISTTALLA